MLYGFELVTFLRSMRNICPGTSANGWSDHRRKHKMEQGKKFLTFSVHYLICDCRTEQPKARKSQAALSAGLGNSSNSRKTTTRAMGTKTLSKLNGNVRPLMDPQPSASSYLPPVNWVNLNNIAKDTPNWHMKGSNMSVIKQCEYTDKVIWMMRESIKYSCNVIVRLQS